MENWNGLDFLILLIFAVNAIRGASRGATRELISMFSLSAGLIIMIRFTITLTDFFNSSPLLQSTADTPMVQRFVEAVTGAPLTEILLKEIFYSLSLLVCFFGPYSLLEAALARQGFVESFPFPYAAINRQVGFTLGFVRGYVFTVILLLILTYHLFVGALTGLSTTFIQNSYFARLFLGTTANLDQLIINRNPDKYREIFKDKFLFTPDMLKKQLENKINEPPGTPNSKTTPTKTNVFDSF